MKASPTDNRTPGAHVCERTCIDCFGYGGRHHQDEEKKSVPEPRSTRARLGLMRAVGRYFSIGTGSEKLNACKRQLLRNLNDCKRFEHSHPTRRPFLMRRHELENAFVRPEWLVIERIRDDHIRIEESRIKLGD